MKLERIEIAGKHIMPIANASGVLATDAYCAANLMSKCDCFGMWISKGTSLRERVMPTEELMRNNPLNLEFGCREPIIVQESDGTFLNAVKLINEGCEKTYIKILNAGIPKDKVICVQVFGNSPEEFAQASKHFVGLAEIVQQNLSCPHAERTGMVFGQDPEMVYRIISETRKMVGREILIDAKLTPNSDNISAIARAAVDAGADWISLINTTGPFESAYLYNGRGGRSGRGIKHIGLEKVREVRRAIGDRSRINGGGGIENAHDIVDYLEAGADMVSLGSSFFCGMDDEMVVKSLSMLPYEIEHGTDRASSYRPKVDMKYKKVRIEKILNPYCDFKVYQTNVSIDAKPGQFVFAFLLGDMMLDQKPGEKPFSIMDDNPLTLGVLTRGYFTRRFNTLKEGDSFYVRGPYGKSVDVPSSSNVVLVGGGCGIAGLYLLSKRFFEHSRVVSFLGAKDKEHIPYLQEFEKSGLVFVATEDGSLGERGIVSDLFDQEDIQNFSRGAYFFNCGPRKMVEALLPLELKFTSPERIYSSVDYMTMCGVGICGRCVDNIGRRSCVEGPFMRNNR
jgi:dihydroorotate dehydrogenase/NAD(P)H-flavin reductase